MRVSTPCRTTIGVALTIVLAGTAAADEFVPFIAPNGVVAAGGQLRFVDLPAFNSHVGVGTSGAPRLTREPTVTAAGFVAQFNIPIEMALFGGRSRIEAGFSLLEGSSRKGFNYSFLATDTFSSVDGQIVGAQGTNGTSANSLRTRYSSYDGAIRFKVEFAVTPTLTFTPSLGLVVGTNRTSYKEAGIESFVGGGFGANSITTRIHSDFIGGELGAEGAWRPAPGWHVHGGVAVALLHQSVRLRASDCAGTIQATPAAFCDAGLFATSAQSSRQNTAFRFGAMAGASYDVMSFARISAHGLVSYNARAPGARVPAGGAALVSAPARIFFDDKVSYGFVVGVTFPLD